MSINFLTLVNASDFSSNVYNYNNLFQALMVDAGAANSGLGTFIQVSSSTFYEWLEFLCTDLWNTNYILYWCQRFWKFEHCF